MGKACLARLFVLGANVIPDVDGGDGGFVVLVNDESQTIIEDEFLERDVDFLTKHF